MNSKSSLHKTGVLFALVTVVLWGILPFFLLEALKSLDGLSIVWFRNLFSTAFLLVGFLIFQPRSLLTLKNPKPSLIIAGFLIATNYVGFIKGLDYTSANNAQVLIQLAPLLFAVFGVYFFKESLNRYQILGLLVANCGFLVFYRDQLLHLFGSHARYNIGNLYILLAAITWALYAALNKINFKQISPQVINLFQYAMSVIIFAPFVDYDRILNLGWQEFAVLCFCGLNTTLAYGCLGEAITRIPAAKVSIMITLNPLITIFMGSLAFFLPIPGVPAQLMNWPSYLGALLVIGGAVLVVSQKRNSKVIKSLAEPH
ncbi:MAG: hypothetical protein COV44_00885 [Deltaproteobacteria bacterium CG11_big_fil_rev_8_21_14_0_20_45_16]|nr:MAG: hypothetical protein COV44_00885 [Deltaproteobacteria bacterium CG11_big_fil_rev_8_21_14_0_20_45_16]